MTDTQSDRWWVLPLVGTGVVVAVAGTIFYLYKSKEPVIELVKADEPQKPKSKEEELFNACASNDPNQIERIKELSKTCYINFQVSTTSNYLKRISFILITKCDPRTLRV
jgi:hypothetical protein